jgi:hypothetical protein
LPPPLPPPPPTVCKDRQPSAYETDLDCGGVCEPCNIEQSCHDPNDCVSGLCVAGICKERLYEPGTPIPPGYQLEPSRNDGASTARWAGIGFFGLSYGAAYLAALSAPTSLGWLYVPLVGPWALLGKAEDFAPEGGVGMTKVLLVSDGAIQVAGALLWLGGVIGRGQQLLRTPTAEQAQLPTVWVSPTVGQDRYSVNFGGLF